MQQDWWKFNNSDGFTVAEMIIAIAVLSFGVILIYGAFFTSFNTTFATGPRFTAAYLANEGHQIIKNIRDNNILDGQNWSEGLVGGFCDTACQVDYKTLTHSQITNDADTFLGLDEDDFYSYDVGSSPTMFKRKIIISEIGEENNILNVNVLVTWTYNGNLFSLTTNQYLYGQ